MESSRFGANVIEVFKKLDRNGDGIISFEEVSDVMDLIGFPKILHKQLFDAADQNMDGFLNFYEFWDWLDRDPPEKDVLGVVCRENFLPNAPTATDKEVIMAAIKDPMSMGERILELAPEELRADEEVVLEAIRRSSGFALKFASQELRANSKFVLEAMKQSCWQHVFKFSSMELKGDLAFVLEVLRLLPASAVLDLFNLVPFELQDNKQFVIQALRRISEGPESDIREGGIEDLIARSESVIGFRASARSEVLSSIPKELADDSELQSAIGLSQVIEVHKKCDRDGLGYISFEDMSSILERIGFDMFLARELFDAADSYSDGFLDVYRFWDWLDSISRDERVRPVWKKAFRPERLDFYWKRHVASMGLPVALQEEQEGAKMPVEGDVRVAVCNHSSIELCEVQVSAQETIEYLKFCVSDKTGISHYAQILEQRGLRLEDHEKLGNVLVTSDCSEVVQVDLIRRSDEEIEFLRYFWEGDWHTGTEKGDFPSWLGDYSSVVRGKRELMAVAVLQNISALPYVSEELGANRHFVLLLALQNGIAALRFASDELKAEKDFVVQVMRMGEESIVCSSTDETRSDILPHAMTTDKEVAMDMVSRAPAHFLFLAETLRANKEFVLKVVQNMFEFKYWIKDVLQNASSALRADKDIIMAAIKFSGRTLEIASKELQADEEVVLAAIKTSRGSALEFASQEMRANKNIVLEAIKQSDMTASVFEFASAELKADLTIVSEAFLRCGPYDVLHLFELLPEELRANKQVVAQAVEKNGEVLESASPSCKSDREIVLKALQTALHCSACKFASEELKSDKQFILEALCQSLNTEHAHWVFENISVELKADKEVVLESIRQCLAKKPSQREVEYENGDEGRTRARSIFFSISEDLASDPEIRSAVEECFTAFKEVVFRDFGQYDEVPNVTLETAFMELQVEPSTGTATQCQFLKALQLCGDISKSQLFGMAIKRIGIPEFVEIMFKEVDKNGDGSIDRYAFIDLFRLVEDRGKGRTPFLESLFSEQ